MNCDVTERDSRSFPDFARTWGKIERLGTRLESQGFSLGLWEGSIQDLHEKGPEDGSHDSRDIRGSSNLVGIT